MPSKTCSCGATMEFARVEGTEKSIPLDPTAPVYAVVRRAGEMVCTRANSPALPGVELEANLFDEPTHWVSHFSTCPDAGAYSQAKSARLQQLVELLEDVDRVLNQQNVAPRLGRAIAALRTSREALRM